MLYIFIPVLLSIVPGAGQIFNREYKKGLLLFFLATGVLLAFTIWLRRMAFSYLPLDTRLVDTALMRNILQNHVVPNHSTTFYTYELVLAALWLYGCVDAYLGAMRRRAGPPSTI